MKEGVTIIEEDDSIKENHKIDLSKPLFNENLNKEINEFTIENDKNLTKRTDLSIKNLSSFRVFQEVNFDENINETNTSIDLEETPREKNEKLQKNKTFNNNRNSKKVIFEKNKTFVK